MKRSSDESRARGRARTTLALAALAALALGGALAWAQGDETVEIELRTGEKWRARLVDFGKRVYRIEVDGKVLELEESKIKSIDFLGHVPPPVVVRRAIDASPAAPDGLRWSSTSLALAGDGRLALTRRAGGDVITTSREDLALWDLSSLDPDRPAKLLRTFAGRAAVEHTGLVAALSRDGRRVLSGSHDGKVELWDAATGELVRTFIHGAGEIRAVAIGPDGRLGFSAGDDGAFATWDLERGLDFGSGPPHEGAPATILELSADGSWLVVGGGTVLELWRIARPEDHLGPQCAATLVPEGRVTHARVSADGRRVVGVEERPGAGVALFVWDVERTELPVRQKARKILGPAGGWVRDLALSPDGTRALTVELTGTLRLWDLAAGRELRAFPGARAHGAVFSASGNRAFVVRESGLAAVAFGGDEAEDVLGRRDPFNPLADAVVGDWALYETHVSLGGLGAKPEPLLSTVVAVGSLTVSLVDRKPDDKEPRKPREVSRLVPPSSVPPTRLPDEKIELGDETVTLEDRAFACKRIRWSATIEAFGKPSHGSIAILVSPDVPAGGLVTAGGDFVFAGSKRLVGFGRGAETLWGRSPTDVGLAPAPPLGEPVPGALPAPGAVAPLGSLAATARAPWGGEAWRLRAGARTVVHLGGTVAALLADGTLTLVDAASGLERGVLGEGCLAIAGSPTGSEVWSVDARRRLRRWAADGRPLATASLPYELEAIAPAPDGTRFLGVGEGRLGLFDAATGAEVLRAPASLHGTAFGILAEGKTALVRGRAGARLWDLTNGSVRDPDSRWPGVAMIAETDPTAFSRDGRQVACGLASGELALLDVASWGATTVPVSRGGGALAFSPGGDTLLWATEGERTLRHRGGATLWTAKGPEPAPVSVAFSPDGERAIVAGRRPALEAWDVERHSVVAPAQGHAGAVTALAASPLGNLVASGGDDGAVVLWDPARGLVGRLEAGERVLAIAFSPDGRLVLVAAEDHGAGSVRAWDTATQAALEKEVEAKGVRSLDVSTDGKLALVGTGSKVLSFPLSGPATFEPHTVPAAAGPAFLLGDGRAVFAAGSEGHGTVVVRESGEAVPGRAPGGSLVGGARWGPYALLALDDRLVAVLPGVGSVAWPLAARGEALAVSPDARLAALLEADGVHVLDVGATLASMPAPRPVGGELRLEGLHVADPTEAAVVSLEAAHDAPRAIAFVGPRTLAIGTAKGVVRVYDLAPAK